MEKISIVKIGGNIINDEKALADALQRFHQIEGAKILVHGGGKLATEFSKKLGIQPQMLDGRRITDSASLEVAVMVYAGLINKQIVSKLQALGTNAIGLSGADANSIVSQKRPAQPIDYGFVGDVTSVNATHIHQLLSAGFSPIFCAITHTSEGQLLNTNADTIACEVAIAMSSQYTTQLFYCFEKKGVLRDINDEDSVIEHINKETYQQLKEKKIIADGMLPKMQNCYHALENGVSQVHLGWAAMIDQTHQIRTILTL